MTGEEELIQQDKIVQAIHLVVMGVAVTTIHSQNGEVRFAYRCSGGCHEHRERGDHIWDPSFNYTLSGKQDGIIGKDGVTYFTRGWQLLQVYAMIKWLCDEHMEEIECYEICEAITNKDVEELYNLIDRVQKARCNPSKLRDGRCKHE
jgi:hypothetical protein